MSDAIRIAVVDDHPLFLEGVVQTLALSGRFAIVAQGTTSDDALAIARRDQPSVILLDVSMPGGGLTAARAIGETCPGVKRVMLTASEADADVDAALELGVAGYILKGTSGPELIRAIVAIHNGDNYVTPSLAAKLLSKTRPAARPAAARKEEDDADLSGREEEILALVAQGLTNKEIAYRLGLSEKTVKHHMTNILQKLQVRNRVEAVLLAHRRAARQAS
ncbi:LuxR C-terminal-related transcriptional regulator [Alsobacter sp. R-9]